MPSISGSGSEAWTSCPSSTSARGQLARAGAELQHGRGVTADQPPGGVRGEPGTAPVVGLRHRAEGPGEPVEIGAVVGAHHAQATCWEAPSR